eukprot:gene15444-2058_t
MSFLPIVALSVASANPVPKVPTQELEGLLMRIADYGVAAGVAANDIKNGSASPASIFINGNMARTVLAAYKIKGNQSHLDAGLAWCDAFVAVQIPLMTSTGEQGGYWDTGYSEIFIADTGTAVAALTLCHSLQPAKAKQAAYEAALRRYTLFVTKGCSTPPTKPAKANATRCPPKGQGWVIPAPFPDAGALGDGYYQGSINLSPYTISTATTGSCAFVEYDDIQKQPELESIAKNAVKWILSKVQADGKIPYILTPPSDNGHTLYQPITYSTESFIDVDLRYPDMHAELSTTLKKTVYFLVHNQSADGSWGRWDQPGGSEGARSDNLSGLQFSPSGDAQRSPRALSLLQWYYMHVSADKEVGTAIQKYATFLANKANQAQYGIGAPTWLALPAGFVGLAVADLLQPWSTFRPM